MAGPAGPPTTALKQIAMTAWGRLRIYKDLAVNLVRIFNVNGRLCQSNGADDSAAKCDGDVCVLRMQRVFQIRLFRHVEELRHEVLVLLRSANEKQTSAIAADLYVRHAHSHQ